MEKRDNRKLLPPWVAYLIFALLCLGFILILRFVRPPNLRTTYSLVFPDVYSSSPTLEIASFDEGEKWRGAFTLDSERTIDGGTGMNMFSINGKESVATLTKTLNLSPYNTVYAYIYADKSESLKNIKSLTLTFGDSKDKTASYEISGLTTGWNFIRMQMADFKPKGLNSGGIGTTSVTLVSKKGQTAELSLDRIWAQKPLRTSDFAVVDLSHVNLKTISKKTFLHLSSSQPSSLVFAKSTAAPRFAYTVSLSPLKFGSFGLSFLTNPATTDGYFFIVTGKAMDTWRLLKKTDGKEVVLQQGTLPPNVFEMGAMLWLRAEKNGRDLTFSYTVDGQKYNPITSYSDSSYNKGNIGLMSSGSYVINSVDFKE